MGLHAFEMYTCTCVLREHTCSIGAVGDDSDHLAMDTHGCRWMSMDTHGPWTPLDADGYPWMPMDTDGYPWMCMDTYGCLWIPMDADGYLWKPKDTCPVGLTLPIPPPTYPQIHPSQVAKHK